jgi:precorrin-6Y C5,15-methyltransferase (decarboxylating)
LVRVIGKEVTGLLDAAFETLVPQGRMVVNVGSVENLYVCVNTMRKIDPEFEVLMVQISRGLNQYGSLRFEAINPSYLLTAVKH